MGAVGRRRLGARIDRGEVANFGRRKRAGVVEPAEFEGKPRGHPFEAHAHHHAADLAVDQGVFQLHGHVFGTDAGEREVEIGPAVRRKRPFGDPHRAGVADDDRVDAGPPPEQLGLFHVFRRGLGQRQDERPAADPGRGGKAENGDPFKPLPRPSAGRSGGRPGRRPATRGEGVAEGDYLKSRPKHRWTSESWCQS